MKAIPIQTPVTLDPTTDSITIGERTIRFYGTSLRQIDQASVAALGVIPEPRTYYALRGTSALRVVRGPSTGDEISLSLPMMPRDGNPVTVTVDGYKMVDERERSTRRRGAGRKFLPLIRESKRVARHLDPSHPLRELLVKMGYWDED